MARMIGSEEFDKEMAHKREVIDMHFTMFRRTAEGAGYKVESKKVFDGKALVSLFWFAEDGKPKISLVEEELPESMYKDADKKGPDRKGPETMADAEKRAAITQFNNPADYNAKAFRATENVKDLKDQIKELKDLVERKDKHIASLEADKTPEGTKEKKAENPVSGGAEG